MSSKGWELILAGTRLAGEPGLLLRTGPGVGQPLVGAPAEMLPPVAEPLVPRSSAVGREQMMLLEMRWLRPPAVNWAALQEGGKQPVSPRSGGGISESSGFQQKSRLISG